MAKVLGRYPVQVLVMANTQYEDELFTSVLGLIIPTSLRKCPRMAKCPYKTIKNRQVLYYQVFPFCFFLVSIIME